MTMGRVLIVDDDGDSRTSLCMVVESWGHEVATAPDGVAALALLAAFLPDVIIIDLGLPGMDGVEVVKYIRKVDGYRAFIIALTGWTRPLDREAALQAGCSLFLLKPTDLGQLERTIERACTSVGQRVRRLR
jgi:CheY-like chemotaxis protein